LALAFHFSLQILFLTLMFLPLSLFEYRIRLHSLHQQFNIEYIGHCIEGEIVERSPPYLSNRARRKHVYY
jgi:hypothetical protein